MWRIFENWAGIVYVAQWKCENGFYANWLNDWVSVGAELYVKASGEKWIKLQCNFIILSKIYGAGCYLVRVPVPGLPGFR